jgi:hypothetical protein
MIARSYCCRLFPGEFSLVDNTTLLHRMALAIYFDRKGIARDGNTIAYLPWWVGELEMADQYGAQNTELPLRKHVWYRRAMTYRSATIYSYQFETKD